MWGALLSVMGGTFSRWVDTQSEIAETKAKARAESVRNGIPGWSDEYLVFIVTFPFIAGFVPGLDQVAQSGIENFSNMPEWYQGIFGTVVLAVFGLDKVIKWKR